MLAYSIEGSFGLENLKLVELEKPKPGPGEILIKMKAVSLNYRDLLVVQGHYDPRQKLPLIPCSDGAGIVEEIGPGVERFKVGDRVTSLFFQKWWSGEPTREKLRSTLGSPHNGTLTQWMVLDQEGAIKIPEHLDFIEASTLPCAALTAWSALVELAKIRPGEFVLLQGTGGVSIFALQFAKALGAKVIITSSSDQKLERAKQLGADYTINYKAEPNWGKKALEITGNRGVDLIVEVGGAKTLEQSLKAIKFGGKIALIGVLSGVSSELNILPIVMKQVDVQGVMVGPRESYQAMNRALSARKLKPVVDKVFPFERAKEAFEYMLSAKHFGKICIEFE